MKIDRELAAMNRKNAADLAELQSRVQLLARDVKPAAPKTPSKPVKDLTDAELVGDFVTPRDATEREAIKALGRRPRAVAYLLEKLRAGASK